MDKGEAIARFLSLKRIGVVGVSRSGRDFGAVIFREFVKRNRAVTPVNREGGTIDGVPMVRTVMELKGAVDGIVVVVPPSESAAVVRDACGAGITNVWLAQGAESGEAVRFCTEHNIEVTHGECPLMFLEQSGFPHALHKGFRKIFGRLPRVPALDSTNV